MWLAPETKLFVICNWLSEVIDGLSISDVQNWSGSPKTMCHFVRCTHEPHRHQRWVWMSCTLEQGQQGASCDRFTVQCTLLHWHTDGLPPATCVLLPLCSCRQYTLSTTGNLKPNSTVWVRLPPFFAGSSEGTGGRLLITAVWFVKPHGAVKPLLRSE